MTPSEEVLEAEITYPAWTYEYLYNEFTDIYEDLIYRRTPAWLKPQDYEDLFYDSIIQKMLLWANPSFIKFSGGFIQTLDSIIRGDIPVVHVGVLFDGPVSFLILNF